MQKNNYCVIMAGGIGSRFWPLSRTSRPKQFLDILGTGKTLIQQTFDRFKRICPIENIYIVTNDIYREQIKEQIPEIEFAQILTEPIRRNTAPCIAYACYKISKVNSDANIIVAPSDHIVLDTHEFVKIINVALETSYKNDCLITLGIKPSRPDTGYGYIQFTEPDDKNLDPLVKKVKTFTEKPDEEIAQEFINSGDFMWNSGIFIWTAKNIINAFKMHLPEIHSTFSGAYSCFNTNEEKSYIDKIYPSCRNISIDYGIMEKAKNVLLILSDFGWSDLGTWGSLYENSSKDKDNNAIIGKNVLSYSTKNCIVNVPDNKLVILQGLNNYIVVESEGILLICKKTDEQKIKHIVEDIKIDKGEKYI